MAEQFLTKTRSNRADCITVGDAAAIERHAELLALLSARVGPEVMALFAEPFISRSGDDGQLTIAWYTDLVGRGERLADLPPEQAARIEARLVSLARPLAFFGGDEENGPLVMAALSIGSRKDIWVVNDHPVLVNWGMKPDPGQPKGTLAGLVAPPPVPAMSSPAAAGPAVESPTLVAGAAATAVPSLPPAAAAPALQAPLPIIAWVPLVVLLAFAAAVLLWLLLPSTRVLFRQAADVAAVPVAVDAAQAATLAALLDQKARLEAGLAQAECRADGLIELPGGLSPEGLPLPPLEGETATPRTSDPGIALLPISPRRLAVPGLDSAETLLDRLEGGTVLILAGNGTEISTGTGFSLGNGFIVTNAHVVETAAAGGQVFVVHQSFGQPMPAALLKVSAPFEESGIDLALLLVATMDLPALALTAGDTPKLTTVIAAGFPADVMETDSSFAALMAGESTAVPDLSVADGLITSVQTVQGGAGEGRLLFHTAPLAKGNSGGPLVDYCGAVVGVNTFVRRNEFRNLNIALSTADVQRFLEGTAAASALTEAAPCQPVLVPGGVGSAPERQGSE